MKNFDGNIKLFQNNFHLFKQVLPTNVLTYKSTNM